MKATANPGAFEAQISTQQNNCGSGGGQPFGPDRLGPFTQSTITERKQGEIQVLE